MNNENKRDEVPFVEQTRRRLVSCLPESGHDKSKNASGRFTKFIVIPFLLLVIAFGIYKILKEEKESTNQQAANNEAISKLVNSHNAITDWKSSFKQSDEIYVADVQEAFIKKDGRPFLLSVEVADVVKEKEQNYVHFRELNSDDPDVRFILECNPEQIKTITEHREESPEYSIIASIVSVRRANKEDVELDADSSDIFIASGQCLDLLMLNNEHSSGSSIAITCLAVTILLAVLVNMVMGND